MSHKLTIMISQRSERDRYVYRPSRHRRMDLEMTIKLGALIGLIVVVPVRINAQEGLTLTVDRLEYTSHHFIHQDISVKNETSRLVRDVKVECNFFNKGELIATSFAYVVNIFPDTIGFRTIIEPSDIPPDRAACRIVLVQ